MNYTIDRSGPCLPKFALTKNGRAAKVVVLLRRENVAARRIAYKTFPLPSSFPESYIFSLSASRPITIDLLNYYIINH